MKTGNATMNHPSPNRFRPPFLAALAFSVLTSAAVADEIRVADYMNGGAVGTVQEYRILDGTGAELGQIREEVTERGSDGAYWIEGESTFAPNGQDEFRATFSTLRKIDVRGLPYPTRFESETGKNGTITFGHWGQFDPPSESFESISIGEERTHLVGIAESKDSLDSSFIERSGTRKTVWKAVGFEEITVPAGSFSALRVEVTTELSFNGDPDATEIFTETSWRVAGVGVVKRTFGTNSTGVPTSHELTAYSSPGDSDEGADPADGEPSDDPDPRYPAPNLFASEDIGYVGFTGSSEWSDDGSTIRVWGSGADIWNFEDGFRFVHTECAGDGEVIVRYLGQNGNHTWAKAGLMIRESLDAGSRHATLVANPGNDLAFIWRDETDGDSASTAARDLEMPLWFRLLRSGDQITGYYSHDRESWVEVGTISIDLPDRVHVGIAVTSHDNDELIDAEFRDLEFHGEGWPADGESNDPAPEPTGPVLVAQDIGAVNLPGSSKNDGNADIITLTGSGKGIMGRGDGFHFLHQQTAGDVYIIAKLTGIDGGGDFAKAGVMIRESLEEDSRFAMLSGSNGLSLSHQWREQTGGFSFDKSRWGTLAPVWLCLYRLEDRIYAYFSRDGTKWELFDGIAFDFPNEIYVGLAVTSSDNSDVATATFESTSIFGSSLSRYQIVEGESSVQATQAQFATASTDSVPTVFFASTGGSLDPVESDSFSLFLNRDGDSGASIPVRYALSGPGANLISQAISAQSLEMNADTETETLTFTLDEDAFIPWNMNFTLELLEDDSYDLGANASVTIRIWARPHDTWTTTHFAPSERADPAVTGDAVSLGGDGVPNLLKYALGLAPRQQIGPEKLPALRMDGQNAALEFERPLDRRDIRYIVEVSTNLKDWLSGDENVETRIIENGGTERVVARDRLPAGEEKQRFMRLRVERR